MNREKIHIGHARKELFDVSHILQHIAQLTYNFSKEKGDQRGLISTHPTVM